MGEPGLRLHGAADDHRRGEFQESAADRDLRPAARAQRAHHHPAGKLHAAPAQNGEARRLDRDAARPESAPVAGGDDHRSLRHTWSGDVRELSPRAARPAGGDAAFPRGDGATARRNLSRDRASAGRVAGRRERAGDRAALLGRDGTDHPREWLWPYKHFRYQPKDAARAYPAYANVSPKFEKLRRATKGEAFDKAR